MFKFGKAAYRNGKLYFDTYSWKILSEYASKRHKTAKQVVIAALKRYAKTQKEVKK